MTAEVAADRLPVDVAALGDHIRRLAPRLEDERGPVSAAATSTQHNRAEGGGDLYASQGGGMTINVDRGTRGRT